MSFPGINARGPNDQKTLNEELLTALVEVAQRNPQHAVEVFGVSLGVAVRLASMSDAQLADVATTPAALWRPALTERVVRALPRRQALPAPAHEAYRPVLDRLNRLALATFARYADDPVAAALVCEIVEPQVIDALQDLPAFAFLEWGPNAGAPLIVPCITDMLLDRLLRAEDDSVDVRLRGLLALVTACEQEFEHLNYTIREESRRHEADTRGPVVKRSGRPPASFLQPRTSSLILTMLRHRLRPSEVEGYLLPSSDVRAAQLRAIAEQLNPRQLREKGAPRDRSRDHRDLWGSAHRRLIATAIVRLQRRLITAGVEPLEAMVLAFDYHERSYEADCGVTLSRMLKDAHEALLVGTETHLSHCAKCSVVYLSHEERTGIIECPVCVLARAGRFGQRRTRGDRIDPIAYRDYGGWPGETWNERYAAEPSRA